MDLLALFSDPAAWLALLTLIALEVVLGVDNLIFIAQAHDKASITDGVSRVRGNCTEHGEEQDMAASTTDRRGKTN